MEYQLKRKWTFFRNIQEMLKFLEKELIFHQTPLPEAFSEAVNGNDELAEGFLLHAAAAMKAHGGESLQQIWKEAVDKVLPKHFLTDEEYAMILELSMALGAADRVMQKTLLERYEHRAEELAFSAMQSYREKGGLYRRLSFLAGIFLVILLI